VHIPKKVRLAKKSVHRPVDIDIVVVHFRELNEAFLKRPFELDDCFPTEADRAPDYRRCFVILWKGEHIAEAERPEPDGGGSRRRRHSDLKSL
jgi:hypothetical protein